MVELAFPRRIIYNEPAGDALALLLEDLGVKSVLLVSDKVLSSMPGFKEIHSRLKSAGFKTCIYTDVSPEPSFSETDAIASRARECGVGAIIAIGGGSVIDAAKTGLVRLVNPGLNLESIAPFTRLGVEGSGIVFIAVPTTSGSGSDASYGVVLTKTSGDGREKIPLGSYELVPYASILDPSLPSSMPVGLTVATGVDVLAHSLEALVSVNSNPLSDALAVKAAGIVFTRLPLLVKNPDDADARAEMHMAATMAGMAFTNSGLGLAHAIAHPLGALLGTHHGATVGLVLPYVVEFNSARSSEARSKYERLQTVLERVLGLPARDSLVDHIFSLYREVGQPSRLRELKPVDYLEELVARVSEAALRDPEVAFNPVVPTQEDIAEILRRLY